MARSKHLSTALLLALALLPLHIHAGELPSGRVVRVIDGDTIAVVLEGERGERTVRYLGLDAPEKEGGNTFFAEEAFRYNRSLVEGRTIWLEFDEQKEDKYGRLLAYVYLDPEKLSMVNAILLAQGMAYLNVIPPNVKYAEKFRKLQAEAKRSGRGIWREIPDIDVDELEKNPEKYEGRFCRVRFKVVEVYESRRGNVFLNSHRDYRTHFAVVIFKNDARKFREKGLDLKGLKRKVIRVTGKVERYKNPKSGINRLEIIARDPSQIEVVGGEVEVEGERFEERP